MWPRDAYVGQRVVCTDDDWLYETECKRLGVVTPKAGTVYTVRKICAWPGEGIGFLLTEIVNPLVSNYGKHEPCFAAEFFKPVDESRLDVFRKMLEPKHADA